MRLATTWLVLFGLALSLCGCGNVQQAAARAKRMNAVRAIGIAYHNYLDANAGKPPMQSSDLKKHLAEFPDAAAALDDGSFTFIYGVKLTDMTKGGGQTVLGYEPQAETDKGVVLMGDGDVRYVDAAEFKTLTKAAPAKKDGK